MASFTTFSVLALAVCLGLVQCQGDFDNRGPFNRRERDQIVSECRSKVMDIYFVLDSSTSIWVNDVESERQFVREVIDRLDVDSRFTRVGALTYSDNIELPTVAMTGFQTQASVRAEINENRLPHRTGNTMTHLAIRYVRQQQSFREDITKVIVVITDGGSRQPGSTAREAQLARESGFYLFVVGVGQYLDESEWRNIASDPDSQFIYNITNFRYLNNVVSSLPARACSLPPIILGCEVNQPTQVYFVAADSAHSKAMSLMRTFDEETVVPNSNLLEVRVYMDSCIQVQMNDLEDINFACQRRGDPARPTEFRVLLNRARSDVRRNNGGSGVPQVVVLFVDDETSINSRLDFSNEVIALENEGATLIVVDLGVTAFANSMRNLLPEDSPNYIRFDRSSVENQPQAKKAMMDAFCDGTRPFQIDGPEPQ